MGKDELMLGPIKFESTITIKSIPIQWLPQFELYYPDLPQFPIVYVHTIKDSTRIYGFPASASFEIREDKTCNVDILFLSNINLEENRDIKNLITKELEERFGSSDKIGLNDILKGCKGQKEYEDFFRELWKYVSKIYGDYLPYGKYYEEVFSMVRFVSAWQPKTGRQSEMRMLYNFLSTFGHPLRVEGKWDYLEFFLIPTYQDIKNKNFSDFPKFNLLFNAMRKMWDIYFTQVTHVSGTKIRSMSRSWPLAKEKFIEKVSYPLFREGRININDRESIERLVDAFNRHSWRAAYFIWSIMTVFERDYIHWDKEFFVNFYTNNYGVGISEKVVACFLQQGFKNYEVIPIDTWVESFYSHVLGIDSLEEFFGTFEQLGKIERAIWLSSQANKTNIKTFFVILWCTRYGDTGNNELRGANPISCYECKLRFICLGFKKISRLKVLIKDKGEVGIKDLLNSKGKSKGKVITSISITKEAREKACSFICITEEKVPKKVFKKIRNIWKLTDGFSGYILTDQKLKNDDAVMTVANFIENLPSFF